MIKLTTIIHIAMISTIPLVVSAETKEGKTVYQQCIACHGVNGEGNPVMQSPALAGQHKAYLLRQLMQYKSGARGAHPDDQQGKIMTGIAGTLDSDAMEAVSAYLSELPSASPREEQQTTTAEPGKAVYQNKCATCHGREAQGNKTLGAPRLSELDENYFIRQMEHFQKGIRGSADNDSHGEQMGMMSRGISSIQVKEIAEYISKIQ